MLTALAIIGLLVIWFCSGYIVESYLKHHHVVAKRRPILMWVEVSVMYGPIGIAVLIYEEFFE